MNILLDTNIVLQISRITTNRKELITAINPANKIFYISVVIEAEIKSIAVRNKWNNERINRLENFLDETRIIDVNQVLVQTYIEIDTYSQRQNPNFTEYPFKTPRNMGKNDLWIASTASILGLELFTSDADFDHLHDIFLDVRKFQAIDFSIYY